jgi:glycosyltransferase involved in cell wall biosynthesis
MPSLWEGLPIVLLEAASSYLPIISTPVGTIPSLIDRNNGYLTDNKSFSETMYYVINNYDEAREKAVVLQKKVNDYYSIESISSKHESLYKRVLDN